VTFGELNIPAQILDNELRIATLEKFLQYLIDNNKGNLRYPSQIELEAMRKESFEKLKLKYPSMGLNYQTL
jgi:hypothetical protein